MPGCQCLKSLDHENLGKIIDGTNCKRLSIYKKSVKSNTDALLLYQLNARLSGLMLEVAGGFEIVLRNAVAKSIRGHFQREDWYSDSRSKDRLDRRRKGDIKNACDELTQAGKDQNSDRIIAELTFHFWVALHEGKHRHRFWVPFLREIWPKGQDLKKLHKDLSKIRNLRNRIAHHEPIFASRWTASAKPVLKRLEQLSPEHRAWLDCRVGPELEAVIASINTMLGQKVS